MTQDPAALVRRRLHLSPHAWEFEILSLGPPLLFRLTHLASRRHVDGRAAYRTKAERDDALVAAVAQAVTTLDPKKGGGST